jgi:prepilin-type N-terminal cleavage/methylation domain-containing protein
MTNKKNKGFTLIETMVAVLLLSVAIAGPLTIASKGLSTALVAKDQIGAYYLAQDAIEYLRFKRDANCLIAGSPCDSGEWLSGIVGAGLCSADGTVACQIDSIQDTVAACSGTCSVLNYDTTNHFYSYTTGAASPERYIRTVKIVTPVGTNPDEAQVTITVQWTGAGGLVHSVTFREDMFNWQ